MSWVRGSMHPANHSVAVSKPCAAWRSLRDISTIWTAVDRTSVTSRSRVRRRSPLPTFVRSTRVSVPSQVRATAVTPSGSANRSRWQGASSPSPSRLSVVAVSVQSSPDP